MSHFRAGLAFNLFPLPSATIQALCNGIGFDTIGAAVVYKFASRSQVDMVKPMSRVVYVFA
jgi:hypothetical protein